MATNEQIDIAKLIELSKGGKIPSCVYFISDGKYVKIGASDNIRKRFNGLQSANARKLYILQLVFTDRPYQLEKELHKKYEQRHIRGEWYDIKDILLKKKVLEERFLTPTEVGERLGISDDKVQQLLDLHLLPSIKFKNITRISNIDLEDFIRVFRTR